MGPELKQQFATADGLSEVAANIGAAAFGAAGAGGSITGASKLVKAIDGLMRVGKLRKFFCKGCGEAVARANPRRYDWRKWFRKEKTYELGEHLPDGSIAGDGPGAGLKQWTKSSLIRYLDLPNRGKFRFVPPDNWNLHNPQKAPGKKGGYLDKFGNEWRRGASRTPGQNFEWDVQIPKHRRYLFGNQSHLNISLDGHVTH